MSFSAPPEPSSIRVLAVASAGGHLVQLRRLRRAFAGCAVTWATTDPAFEAAIRADADADAASGAASDAADGTAPPLRFAAVPEGSRWNKIALLRQMFAVLALVIRTRPHVVITTGAAPGYFAIRAAKLLGARTIWIDSVANAEELSLSGREAGRHASLFLTQWPHLAAAEDEAAANEAPAGRGPRCFGSVI